MCAMLSAFTPPSTSGQMSLPVALIRRRVSAIFGTTDAMNCCPPKPGFTDISSTRSSFSSVWSSQTSGVAGLNARPALQPCSRMSESVRSMWSDASGWKLMMFAPALAKSPTSRSTGFTITLRNTGSVAAQLISRHWIITDAQGLVQEVRGLGVVGAQPRLEPGESFEYTSGASIATAVGTMKGSYQMVAADGTRFEAEIPQFTLSVPRVLH